MKRTNAERLKSKHQAKRERLRGERERADLLLGVLCAGIGNRLTNCGQDRENIGYIKELFDAVVLPAAEAAETASEAYRPYWGRRYRRATRKPKPKPAVVK